MSPTVAELAVGLIAAGLVFMLALRVIPLVIRYLAEYFNRSLDAEDYVEKEHDHYDHYQR